MVAGFRISGYFLGCFILIAGLAGCSSSNSDSGWIEDELGTGIDPSIKQAVVELVENEQEAYEVAYLTPSNASEVKTVSTTFEHASKSAKEYLQEYDEMVIERSKGDQYAFGSVTVSAERAPSIETSSDGKTVTVIQSIWADVRYPNGDYGPGFGDDHVLTFDAKTGELLSLDVPDPKA